MTGPRTNEEWLAGLTAEGETQQAALEDLSALLLRAAAYTAHRTLGNQAQFSREEIDSLAEDCAQDALLAVLDHLQDFRGDSLFTTWAYKFAVNISLSACRRELWKGRSLDDLPGIAEQKLLPARGGSNRTPESAAIRREVWHLIAELIQNDLTEKQRQVVTWMIFDDVPMDVVVDRLSTNRNAVYKLLHDARLKLKTALLERGIGLRETIDLFG